MLDVLLGITDAMQRVKSRWSYAFWSIIQDEKDE